MMKKPVYKMREKVWLYPAEHGMDQWHFVNVGEKASQEIKKYFSPKNRGFGSIPVLVTAGRTSWKTSIFPDRKTGIFILPLKADVRKQEGIRAGTLLSYTLEIMI